MPNEPAARVDDEVELFAFANPDAAPPADPAFRERLRAELWEVLQGSLAPPGPERKERSA